MSDRQPVRRSFPSVATWAWLTFVAILLWRVLTFDWQPPPGLPDQGELHLVERVVDGDTLLLSGGRRVRLIGVDTPESVHPDRPAEPFGKEASDFTRSQVEQQSVQLEFDRERVDPYGRLLAYVYIDGRNLNEAILREGLGRVMTSFPYRSDMKRRFIAAESEAKAHQRGLWSAAPQ